MSWYTRILSSIGQKEARRIEATLGKKIKELSSKLRASNKENALLKDMLLKAEERHIHDITSINAKLDAMSEKLNDWIKVAEENKAELEKTKDLARFADEQRDMWMSIVEKALEENPEMKLSDLLRASRADNESK